MLYWIVDPRYFDKCLANAKQAYWPEARYLKHRNELMYRTKPVDQDAKLKQTEQLLQEIVDQVADESIYQVLDDFGKVSKCFPLPFLDRFHRFFLTRRWNEPYADPVARADDLFRLVKPKSGNYSSKAGDYHHFCNVVAALARLVMFFQDTENLRHAFEDRSEELGSLVYGKMPSPRTFKLMLAAFYHDLGKTLANPRHAGEGAIILAHHTTLYRYRLDQIIKTYDPAYEFDRDDFLFIADLVFYHDHYGTVGTGEDGYQPLVAVIDRIKRYSLRHDTNKGNQIVWTRCYLFDLWLLNVADIMVSLDHKFDEQTTWLEADKAKSSIQAFFADPQGMRLVHDFKITMNLLKVQAEHKHSDDLSKLEAEALERSRRHVTERLRRLMIASLRAPLSRRTGDNSTSPLRQIAVHVVALTEAQWIAVIIRSIRAVADPSEFIHRFSLIGKMDYALGFFEKIANAALVRIEGELKGGEITGWLRKSKGKIDPPFLEHVQAQFIADNYAATVIQILGYLLFREPCFDRVRNIEFSDASNRLTDEKLTQLLSLEGPARTRRAVEFVLQTIYIY